MPSNMFERKATQSEIAADQRAYFDWVWGNSTNREEIEEVKRVLLWALNNVLTDKQRLYMIEYYINDLNTVEIGEKYNRDKSCISRTLKRARRRLWLYTSIPMGTYGKEENPFGKLDGRKQRYSSIINPKFRDN